MYKRSETELDMVIKRGAHLVEDEAFVESFKTKEKPQKKKRSNSRSKSKSRERKRSQGSIIIK